MDFWSCCVCAPSRHLVSWRGEGLITFILSSCLSSDANTGLTLKSESLKTSPVLILEKTHSFLDDIDSLGMILRSARGAIAETEVTCDEQNVAIFTLPNEYGAC
jgi:hypothetical protein